ncbi:MAG: Bax inhibitor-1/YccA family protein [Gammaproteobacteria bacterium]|nr:Bax inhibitor-1/YccA family protein [Gammaproteobacteria bacterium]
MNDYNPAYAQSRARSLDMSVDAGLRAFMLGVYNKLGLGLLLSGALAYVTSSVGPVQELLFQTTATGRFAGYTPLGLIVNFSPLVLLFGSMFVMRSPSAKGASFLYWAVVASIGASLGVLGLVYTGQSLTQTFFITAAAFFGLSLWGYTTKRDLSGMGSFLMMGLIGLIVAMVVNLFLQSPALMFAISAIGVLVFAGLIAYDTQRLKLMYAQTAGNEQAMSVATSFGALSLYINVINLFQFLLMFLGVARD